MAWPFTKKAEKSATPAKKAGPPNLQARQFQAAILDRLTSSWSVSQQSMDWELRNALPVIRSRARDLAQNNDYAKKFLQMCATHVVGPSGFNLRVQVLQDGSLTEPDKAASDAIEAAFWKWAKPKHCEVTGKLSFFDLCNLFIKTVARDGEVLLRKVYNSKYEFGFKLQVLEVDRLDTQKNDVLKNGNVVKMGVELSPYGEPVNYYIRTAHPGDTFYSNNAATYEIVPAEEIYHLFVAERPEQNRGIPWMHTAIIGLKNLGGYREAALFAARVGASKMGFYTTPDGDGTPLADGTDQSGNLIQDAEPGVMGVLPPGYDFKSFDPDYPHAMFGDFVKSCLRGVASGLGVAYNTISNDLEGVNFSSIRTGVLEERDNWMAIQNWVIEQFLDDLFPEWLRWALLKGAVKLPNGSPLPASKFDKFNAATWQGRRWQWVDPKSDAESNILLINNGLKSREDVIAEQGKDVDDTFTQLAEEQKKLKTLGIETTAPNPNQPAQAAAPGGKPAADEAAKSFVALIKKTIAREQKPGGLLATQK